jgi:hypothetical protein
MPDPAIGTPPTDVTDELTALAVALDRVVPAKTVDNLLIGTWNVRAFDRVNPKWRSATGEPPIRDHSNVACTAEIVSRFDVIAIHFPRLDNCQPSNPGCHPRGGVKRCAIAAASCLFGTPSLRRMCET